MSSQWNKATSKAKRGILKVPRFELPQKTKQKHDVFMQNRHKQRTRTWCQSSPTGMFRTVVKWPHMSELNQNFGGPVSTKPLQMDPTQKRNLWQSSHSETVCNQGRNDALNTKQWKKMVQWLIFYRISCIQAGLSYEKAKGCLQPATSVASCETWWGVCKHTGRDSHKSLGNWSTGSCNGDPCSWTPF